VADKYDCISHIKLKQEVSEAMWDEQQSKWQLRVNLEKKTVNFALDGDY
jgi:cation diffusion facilitator CzcD-associated flavoprotein CzcO